MPFIFIHAFPYAAALNAITLLFCSPSQPMEGPLLFLLAHPTGQPFLSGPPRCLTEDLWCGAGHPRMGVGEWWKDLRLLPLLLANRLLDRGQVMLRALWLLWLKELLSGRSRWHWGVKEGVRIRSGNSCSEWKEYWAENYLKWEAVKSLRL